MSAVRSPPAIQTSTAEGVARHHAWLKPHFWDDSTDDLGSRIGSWIVRTPEHLVVIDTGVGNDKNRESNMAEVMPFIHEPKGQ